MSMFLSRHQDITIRLATKSDYDDVLEMSENIYEGFDVLSVIFLEICDDASYTILVAEKDNKVIGLVVVHIIDDGKCVVIKYRRVHINYRGKGIGELLSAAVERYVHDYLPQVKVTKYTTAFSNARTSIQNGSSNESIIDETSLTVWYIESFMDTYSKHSGKLDMLCSKVAALSHDEFTNMLVNGKLNTVMKNNTLMIDIQPFQALLSNIPLGLLQDDDFLFVSVHEGVLTSFSQGRTVEKSKYIVHCVTVYTADESLMKAHILKQLVNASVNRKLFCENKTFTTSLAVPPSLLQPAKEFLENNLSVTNFVCLPILLVEKIN